MGPFDKRRGRSALSMSERTVPVAVTTIGSFPVPQGDRRMRTICSDHLVAVELGRMTAKLADMQVEWGHRFMRAGMYEEAAERFHEAASNAPGSLMAWVGLGIALTSARWGRLKAASI